MKKNIFLFVILLFVLVSLFILLDYHDKSYQYQNNGDLYINEILASNSYTVLDDKDSYSDYIELYNGYDNDLNLKGYYLSDDEYLNKKWKFPDLVIKSHEYLLIYADGLNTCDKETYVCHTNFKLDKKGEVVSLSNSQGKILSKIRYEEVDNDISFGLIDKKYGYFYKPTPGYGNDSEYELKPVVREHSEVNLVINEYMNNNQKSLKDRDNDYVNFVELYNMGETDINLKGYYLSDKEKKINKYELPEVIIKAHEYLVIYLSGKDKYENNEIHANFKLDTDDTVLVLSSDNGSLIDKVYLDNLSSNISAGLYDNKMVYYTKITPGYSNDDDYYTDMALISDRSKSLIVNEVSSDAIEVKNVSDTVINLSNYGISDKKSNIVKLPNVNLNPGSYYILYQSDYYSYSYGKLYTGFKISNSDEIIYLYDNSNYVIDKFESGMLFSNVSYGRNADFKEVLYGNVTLGYDNSNTYYLGYSNKVNYSVEGGYVDKDTEVNLTNFDNSTIYYTTDGSMPSTNSNKYNSPIKIDKTMVIKAISVRDNYLPSEVVSRTYFIGRKHDLAIVSLSTNKDNLFSNQRGIMISGYYNNFRQDWERDITFEFYENDGSFGTMFNGGIKLVGQDSRSFPQKSMAIYLRKKYGLQEVTYPFFEDEDAVATFSSFVLRNSGEDVNYLKMKDTFLIATIKDQMDLDFQYYRPVVVYLNGEYWGLYNIREKINESYLENNHGVTKDNVDLIKGNNDVRAGSMDNYNDLINYVKTHDVTSSDVYNELKKHIDVQELVNYWIVQTYYQNTDTGNIRFWRDNNQGKWRWVLFDLDWSMWPSTYTRVNLFYPFEPYGHGTGKWFSTTLTYYLYKNSEFRDLYLSSFAYHMKNTFVPDRLIKILDEMVGTLDNEMPYHIDRWYNDFVSQGLAPLASMDQWNSRIDNMKYMIKNRYDLVKRNIKSEFNLSDSEYQKYFSDL